MHLQETIPITDEWKNKYLTDTLIIKELYNKKIMLVTGDESSGKTTLAKKIYKDALLSNKIPLLFIGKDFVSFERQKVIDIVEKEFCRQYSKELYDKYIYEDYSNKVIIIDDIYECKLNSEGLKKLLDLLSDIFGYILMFCNENYRMNKFMDKNTAISYSDIFSCTIMPFGCLKRDELIGKWILLGQEFLLEKDEVSNQCLLKGRIIDNIIGTGWVPAYPGYLLIIMQQLELNNTIDTKMSSHGYLYQYMINKQLSVIGKTPQDINIFDQVLIDIAGYMLNKNSYQMSELELKEFINEYNNNYKMSCDMSIINKLINGRLLDSRNGMYFFKHKYVLYYFTSIYLQSNINSTGMRDKIYEFCSRLYSEKYANIVIFLCHISRDRGIIEEIIYKSFEVFDGIETYDFINHKKFISSVDTGLKKVLLPDTNLDINRRNMLKKRELIKKELYQDSAMDEQPYYSEMETEYVDEPIEILLFNKAFKTLEIMGQILKNYPGSLKGDIKRELIMECHNLSMRTLNVFLIFADKAIEEGLLEKVVNNKEFSNELTREEKYKLVDDLKQKFVRLAEYIATSFIIRLSISIGDKYLKDSYYDIFKENEGSYSYKLLEIAINLFCMNYIPEQVIMITSMNLKKTNNYFSYEILRSLVGHFLYLHGCKDVIMKQRLCSELNIDSKDLLLRQKKY